MSTHFVSPHCLMKKKKETVADTLLHFLYPLSLSSKRHPKSIFPPNFLTQSGIVSRGCLQKGNRRGHDVYTFRIPSLSDDKKGNRCRYRSDAIPLGELHHACCLMCVCRDTYGEARVMRFSEGNCITLVVWGLLSEVYMSRHRYRTEVMQFHWGSCITLVV